MKANHSQGLFFFTQSGEEVTLMSSLKAHRKQQGCVCVAKAKNQRKNVGAVTPPCGGKFTSPQEPQPHSANACRTP